MLTPANGSVNLRPADCGFFPARNAHCVGYNEATLRCARGTGRPAGQGRGGGRIWGRLPNGEGFVFQRGSTMPGNVQSMPAECSSLPAGCLAAARRMLNRARFCSRCERSRERWNCGVQTPLKPCLAASSVPLFGRPNADNNLTATFLGASASSPRKRPKVHNFSLTRRVQLYTDLSITSTTLQTTLSSPIAPGIGSG